MGAGDATPTALPLSDSLEFHSMPTQTPTIGPIRPDSIPMGSDFVGGVEALPVRSTGPGEVVPGSDFAGGALPLATQVERGEADKEQAA
jgi:hypothetical protein